MKKIKAQNMQQANEFLKSGEYKNVILDFDISSDEFFTLVSKWLDRGAKIKKEEGLFTIKPGKDDSEKN